jgi:hypothetical protein
MKPLETHVSPGLSRIRLLNLLRLRFPIKYTDDLIQGNCYPPEGPAYTVTRRSLGRRAVGPLEGTCNPAVRTYLPGV